MVKKKRIRKLRTFTLSDEVYYEFKKSTKNMSRELEKMIKSFMKKTR